MMTMNIESGDLIDWAPGVRRSTDPTPFLVIGPIGANDLRVKTLAGRTLRVSKNSVTRLPDGRHAERIRKTFSEIP